MDPSQHHKKSKHNRSESKMKEKKKFLILPHSWKWQHVPCSLVVFSQNLQPDKILYIKYKQKNKKNKLNFICAQQGGKTIKTD